MKEKKSFSRFSKCLSKAITASSLDSKSEFKEKKNSKEFLEKSSGGDVIVNNVSILFTLKVAFMFAEKT